jgi:predicted transcriptional regulator
MSCDFFLIIVIGCLIKVADSTVYEGNAAINENTLLLKTENGPIDVNCTIESG